MNTSPAIASGVKKLAVQEIQVGLEPPVQTAQVSAFVPTSIQVERIQTIGFAQIPQIIYTTAKGRCSTLLSKAQFTQIWQCWLNIRLGKPHPLQTWKIQSSGIELQTHRGKFLISFSEAKAFLSRYNRVGIEPLSVKFNPGKAVVWNPHHQTLSQVSDNGCSCADSLYRNTLCKHQIAVEICRMNSTFDPQQIH